MTRSLPSYRYQSGGSLAIHSPTYVIRQADQELLAALNDGEFCYVFNARQMGKSSMLFRTIYQLQQKGHQCAFLDMTRFGSEIVQPEQWYRGIVFELWRGLHLSLDLKNWWAAQAEFSPVQRLSHFLEDVLLVQFPQESLFIFIDEIDSILSLDFPVDDFFALLRFCYNQRVLNPAYRRLTFALSGVATPSDLIQDLNRTPFNIGRAIDLAGFQLEETEPLVTGLIGCVEQPQAVLKSILNWTGGQPFLTQKLCQMIVEEVGRGSAPIEGGDVDHLVQTRIIRNWEIQDNPEHLRTIRDRIERNSQSTGRMLSLYQQILQGRPLSLDASREQSALLLSGLVVQEQGILKVKNKIYRKVFNDGWIQQKLADLRPYSQILDAWVASQQQDTSRLLRGQALQQAQDWTRGRSLSDLDYQFLANSEAIDRQEVQQVMEAERLREVEARLKAERESTRRQRYLVGTLATAFTISIGLLAATLFQKLQLTVSEIRSISTSSEALLASNQRLEALVQAIKAKRRLQSVGGTNLEVDKALQKAVFAANEQNRLSGRGSGTNAVAFSPDGQLIAAASLNGTVRLWRRDGLELGSLTGHQDRVMGVVFSPDGKAIASASADGTVRLWQLNQDCVQRLGRSPLPNPTRQPPPLPVSCFTVTIFKGHQSAVWKVTFSPDGKRLASASWDHTVKLWKRDGTLLTTLKGHQGFVLGVAFSPDGNTIASASFDRTIKLWTSDGILITTLKGHTAGIADVEFSPDGTLIASCGEDATIRIWRRDGTLVHTLTDHEETVADLAFSPDGETLASVSYDSTIKLWSRSGRLISTLKGNQGELRGVAFSPDGRTVVSGGLADTVRLWQPTGSPLITRIEDTKNVTSVTFQPQGNTIATGAADGSLKFWNHQGKLLKVIQAHRSRVERLAYSPDGQALASAGLDGDIHLWNQAGKRLHTIQVNGSKLESIAFSPSGNLLASASSDEKIRLWDSQGNLQTTLQAPSTNPFFFEVAFSPNGQMIAATGGDRTIAVWTPSGTLLRQLKGHTAAVWSLGFSPNSDILASASSDRTVKLWNLDGTLLHTLSGHQAAVNSVVFSPDGTLLASGSSDSTVKLWQPDGTLRATLEGHTAQVNGIAFSSDGKVLASVSSDRSIVLWHLNQVTKPGQILEAGCAWIRDYLHHNPNIEEGDRTLCDNLPN